MAALSDEARRQRLRNLLYMSEPGRWPAWPFLPLVRHTRDGEECGLLCDVMRLAGKPGYSATVFLANLFLLPRTLEEFLALPREVFDAPEEVYDAGWRID